MHDKTMVVSPDSFIRQAVYDLRRQRNLRVNDTETRIVRVPANLELSSFIHLLSTSAGVYG